MTPEHAHIGDPLDCLMEECGEVIQAVCKIKRFGIGSINPKTGVVNTEHLKEELGDLKYRIKQVEEIMGM